MSVVGESENRKKPTEAIFVEIFQIDDSAILIQCAGGGDVHVFLMILVGY